MVTSLPTRPKTQSRHAEEVAFSRQSHKLAGSQREGNHEPPRGKLDPNVRVVIAKVGAGVFVKKGAAKPDISSVEAFKRTLLNAKSIALADPASGGAVPL